MIIRNKILSVPLLLAAGICAESALAQESFNSSGGDASGSGGSAAFSIGQVVYTTNSDASGSVAQGVQHAYEIFTLSVAETRLAIALSVFPNPTADFLNLDVSNYSNEILSWQLIDLNGRLIETGSVKGQQTQINMRSLATASYHLIVADENKALKTFKFIKHN